MFKRSTVILLILAFALIVGSWGIDTLQSRRQQQLEADSRLLALDIDQVERIEIERPNEDPSVIVVEQGADDGGLDPDWLVVEPVNTNADDFTVRALLRSAADLKATAEIEGDPTLSDFGLDPAVESLTLTLADGSTQTLQLGDPDFDQTGLYAMTDSGRVVTIASGERSALAPTLFQIRDKELLSIRSDRLESIEIAQSDQVIELNYDDDRWQIISPELLPADETVVSALVSPLTSLQAASFVAETQADESIDLAELGLENPSVTVTLTLRPEIDGDPEQTAVISLGSPAPNGQHYVLTSASPAVATISEATFAALTPELTELRSQALVSLDLADIASLTIVSSHNPALDRTLLPSVENPGQWEVSDQPERLVSLNSFWQALAALQATDFVPEGNSLARRAMAEPRLVLTLERLNQAEPVELTFGIGGNQAYGRSPQQPEIAQLERADYDEIETLLGTFKPLANGSNSSSDNEADESLSEDPES
ncbi:MAG: DUF4340 domain-containing protein [Synechococcaceae cyanobacterium SM2_3_2]|nr:DUF4340 domain-containing protein [Synechococcaceae cyanobacterium SM2_3_2]